MNSGGHTHIIFAMIKPPCPETEIPVTPTHPIERVTVTHELPVPKSPEVVSSENHNCHNDGSIDCDLFPGVIAFRRRFISNFIFAHLNVNSYRHKYISIHDILAKKNLDYLAISESKLDDSFPSAQFPAHDYSIYRQDVSSSSGGLLVYVRADLSHRRLNHAEINVEGFESLCMEITVGKTTTILSCIYINTRSWKMMFLNVISQIWLTLSLELIVISCFPEIWTVVQQKVQWFKIFVRSMGVLILLQSPRVIRATFLRSLMSYLWLIRTSISAL